MRAIENLIRGIAEALKDCRDNQPFLSVGLEAGRSAGFISPSWLRPATP